jgi:hypothetical protein
MRQLAPRRAHLGDHSPNPCPDQQSRPVAVPEHQIGISGGLELSVIAELVHHRVGRSLHFEIRQHFPSIMQWVDVDAVFVLAPTLEAKN